MLTLEEALKLSKEDLEEVKKELNEKARREKHLGAYIEQFENKDLSSGFDGVPIAIKDNIQVKGWNITSSSKILQGYIAPYNATVIEKLLANSLAPFGRTNMDEFAMGSTTETSYYGRTLNPRDNSKVPGGSSGGSACAVAANLAIAALGSDTGGSIRQPAAYCGCVGFKPSYGRVSRYGLGAYASSLDQIGPITQNVKDAAILFDIISGYDTKDSTSMNLPACQSYKNLDPNKKLTIAVIKNYIDNCEESMKKALYLAIEKLENFGHKIIYKELGDAKFAIAAYYTIANAEASSNLSRYDGIRYGRRAEGKDLKELYLNTRSEGFGEEVKRRILLGSFVLSSGYYDAYYIKAQKARTHIKAEYEEIFKEADIIFMPVTPTVAHDFGKTKNPLELYLSDIYTIGINLAGLPALTLPVGEDENSMNISAQLVAPSFEEQILLDAALNLENIIKG